MKGEIFMSTAIALGRYQTYTVKLHVFADKARASRFIAGRIAQVIHDHPAGPIGFATGSSQLEIYRNLAEMHRRDEFDASRLVTSNLDEYVGITMQYMAQTYAHYMQHNLFGPLGIPLAQTHMPNWRAANSDLECEDYERVLKQIGRRRFQLLGTGKLPHIGFCEKGTSFNSRTHVVRLAFETRVSNSRFFMAPGERQFLGLSQDQDPHEMGSSWDLKQQGFFQDKIMPRVPTHAMTMGITSILDADELLLDGFNAIKAQAIFDTLMRYPTEGIPSTALRLHRKASVVVDIAAAKKLPEQYQREGEYEVPVPMAA